MSAPLLRPERYGPWYTPALRTRQVPRGALHPACASSRPVPRQDTFGGPAPRLLVRSPVSTDPTSANLSDHCASSPPSGILHFQRTPSAAPAEDPVPADVTPIHFAQWVQANYPYAHLDPLTHLKLQKLAFYAYGAAMAFEADAALPPVAFEAWEHGPVCRAVWLQFRSVGKGPLAPPAESVQDFDPACAGPMRDALAVYGLLRAWPLREQSHLEAPWRSGRASPTLAVDHEEMRAHFRKKFNSGAVAWPEYLVGAGSLRLDGIPVAQHASLASLADAVRATARRLESGRAEVR